MIKYEINYNGEIDALKEQLVRFLYIFCKVNGVWDILHKNIENKVLFVYIDEVYMYKVLYRWNVT